MMHAHKRHHKHPLPAGWQQKWGGNVHERTGYIQHWWALTDVTIDPKTSLNFRGAIPYVTKYEFSTTITRHCSENSFLHISVVYLLSWVESGLVQCNMLGNFFFSRQLRWFPHLRWSTAVTQMHRIRQLLIPRSVMIRFAIVLVLAAQKGMWMRCACSKIVHPQFLLLMPGFCLHWGRFLLPTGTLLKTFKLGFYGELYLGRSKYAWTSRPFGKTWLTNC